MPVKGFKPPGTLKSDMHDLLERGNLNVGQVIAVSEHTGALEVLWVTDAPKPLCRRSWVENSVIASTEDGWPL